MGSGNKGGEGKGEGEKEASYRFTTSILPLQGVCIAEFSKSIEIGNSCFSESDYVGKVYTFDEIIDIFNKNIPRGWGELENQYSMGTMTNLQVSLGIFFKYKFGKNQFNVFLLLTSHPK